MAGIEISLGSIGLGFVEVIHEYEYGCYSAESVSLFLSALNCSVVY